MPIALVRQLKAVVKRLHPDWSEERKNAYIFGTLRKTGWRPAQKKKKPDWDKYRRRGKPRTDAERKARHKRLYQNSRLEGRD